MPTAQNGPKTSSALGGISFAVVRPASPGLRIHCHLLERPREQILDRFLAVVVDLPRARAGEVRMGDHRRLGTGWRPVSAGPAEPRVLVLIEHEQRLVAQLRELRAPSRAAAHGLVVAG